MQIKWIKRRRNNETPTCWLKEIFSSGDFLVKLERKESGKTKAALPAKTNPSRIELTPIDFPGLQRRTNQCWSA